MAQSSPFKFLDAFEKKDGKNFHGRKAEIEALYGMAYESNLILVYGRSGTGKTSLIQCGLANRFKSADWMDIYIRRKDNINDSLREALVARLPKEDTAQEDDLLMEYLDEFTDGGTSDQSDGDVDKSDVVSVLTHLNESYFKPVYLIFDQFEELFILGKENARKEQREFYRTLIRIKAQCSFCHVILVLREEWIAELSDLERAIPDLFSKRLRVEPLTRTRAVDVVEKTCSDFNIKLDGERIKFNKEGEKPTKGENKAAALIVDEISKGRTELTYLQVFLDALWRKSKQEGEQEVDFSIDDIKALGGIEDVLADFLESQSTRIQSELESQFTHVDPRAVRNILGEFVSIENTKQPRTAAHFESVPNDQLDYCLNALEQARILRYDNEAYYELSHDALAAKIAEDRDPAEIAYLEVIRLVKNGFKSYQDSPDVSLTKGQLARFDEHKEKIVERKDLSSSELDFVSVSRRSQTRSERRRIVAVASFAGLILIGGLWVLFLYLKANQESYKRFVEVGNRAYEAGNYNEAIDAFKQALSLNEVDSVAAKRTLAEELAEDKIDLDSLMQRGDGLAELDPGLPYLAMCDRLIQARSEYVKADQLRMNRSDKERLDQRRVAVEAELEYRRRELETRADVMEDARSPESLSEAEELMEVIDQINKSLGDG